MTVINTEHILGGLYAQDYEGKQLAFPLKHTEVKTSIAENIGRTEVTQSFENPFNQDLEAKYIFPFFDEVAVDEMEIIIGEKIIKGN